MDGCAIAVGATDRGVAGGACECDVEETSFLLDVFGQPVRVLLGIGQVHHDVGPLLPLDPVDGRQVGVGVPQDHVLRTGPLGVGVGRGGQVGHADQSVGPSLGFGAGQVGGAGVVAVLLAGLGPVVLAFPVGQAPQQCLHLGPRQRAQ